MVMGYRNYYTAIPWLGLLLFHTTSALSANENQQATSRYFEKIRKAHDNARLTQFFVMMPKGGDLHHHYSGVLYAETYLDWAAKKNMCIDARSMQRFLYRVHIHRFTEEKCPAFPVGA